jgi:hypothetical protein
VLPPPSTAAAAAAAAAAPADFPWQVVEWWRNNGSEQYLRM